jgi:hypothetical protein
LEKIGLNCDVNKAGHWHADDAHRTGNVKGRDSRPSLP